MTSRPSNNAIRLQVAELRACIEDPNTDGLERRLAQVAEDALRWATEETDWAPPREQLAGMASIVRQDPRVRLKIEADVYAYITNHVRTCVAALRDEDGRSKTRELAIAVTKLQEAAMWIEEHQRRKEDDADRNPTAHETAT